MGADAWVTLLVVVGVVVLLVRESMPPAGTAMGGAIVLVLAGVLEVEEAFAGFSNSAIITVAAMYVVAGGVTTSGLLEGLVARLVGSGRGERGILARLLLPVAAASTVLNNTPIVAAMAPAVAVWATEGRRHASRFLMPLSYAAILGGIVTTIGTSTNLIVSGLLQDRGLASFDLFAMTPVALPVAIAGLALLVILSPRLLPDRESPTDQVFGHARRYAVPMRVETGGSLDGRTIAEAGLRNLPGLFLAAVARANGDPRPAAADTMLRAGDVLTFVGAVERIVELQEHGGLASAEGEHVDALEHASPRLHEAVVGSSSPLVGRTLKDARFRSRYDAAVLALHRDGEQVAGKLGDVPLRPGDAVLLLTDESFDRRWAGRPDFAVIAPTERRPGGAGRGAWIAGGVLVVMVALAATGVVDILEAALGGAFVMVLARVLTFTQARDAVDLDVILLLAGSFALGTALERSGLADLVAGGVVAAASGGRLLAVAAVVLGTMALTEPLSNSAAAALMLPVALVVADRTGADPHAFAVAVAIGASASFLTPIGYQTNTMVYGLGGYRFTDYARIGLPLTVASFVATVAGTWLVAW